MNARVDRLLAAVGVAEYVLCSMSFLNVAVHSCRGIRRFDFRLELGLSRQLRSLRCADLRLASWVTRPGQPLGQDRAPVSRRLWRCHQAARRSFRASRPIRGARGLNAGIPGLDAQTRSKLWHVSGLRIQSDVIMIFASALRPSVTWPL